MKINNLNLSKQIVGLWIISAILCIVSIGGILSFPNLLQSSHTLPQYIVVSAHALYVIAGIIIVIGLWRSIHFTPIVVIMWGIGSLGAGLGGPLVFSATSQTFLRTSIVLTIFIIILTIGLFLYTRNFIQKNNRMELSK